MFLDKMNKNAAGHLSLERESGKKKKAWLSFGRCECNKVTNSSYYEGKCG